MFRAFTTALSAMNASATGVDVVGNNLANLNTPGFKSSAMAFHDIIAQTIGATGTETQVGLGTGRPKTVRQFNQGAIQTSGGGMDAAIQGGGFFVVKDSLNQQVFTRAGNFQLDALGNLLTATGERVQGWREVNGVVDINAPVGDVVLPVGQLRPPTATSTMSVDLNLNAAAATGATFSTPVEVVDSLGVPHVLTVTFTKQAAANTWQAQVSIPGAEVAAGTAGTPYNLLATPVTVVLSSSGVLTTPASPGNTTVPAAGLVSGAANLSITWSLYNNAVPRLTQYNQPSAVSAVAQNGSLAAQLTKVAMNDTGKITAQYSNGQQKLVAQLAMAFIQNPESLVAAGNNNLSAGPQTALPAIGPAETGGRGKILGGAIESSTVDIAREFTSLIVLQRWYQASARMVTTADELTQETISLKR
ncbi:MAG: flagellar hook protein FlgE [Acidobacteria bacterium]|nr:flagellar hook protein FlgE [Acidobacteriota bacterium]